ncbi:MAG: hypothetical protein K2Q25_15170 [Mycobacteriaceae bacterium]|nr:hypothetical protein [Mycobacteriaceae bacterium]
MTTYTAIARQDAERGWLIRIPGLGAYPEEGLPTWARSLADVEPMSRDLISVWLEIPEDSFNVEVQVDLPDTVKHHLDMAAKLRQDAADAQAASAEEYRRAAIELKDSGLTMRDIGKALGFSYQRAHQLVSGMPASI